MADVESLELQITGDAKSATDSLNTLIGTLKNLKQATAGGCGLSSVSNEMKKLNNINIGLSSSNKASGKSFGSLTTRVAAAALSLKKVGTTIASWITESNEYVENLNLFTVSMGEYAGEAQKYAEMVGDLMGIDPSAWMRNQGVFMTLATGFGVATDRAATMSQQLTQLGYDISSFYNTSVEDAMQRLQSGLSGELEPLRRLGYDLSQAKLEATALSLGIDKAVSSMTQAEKAELRYYAIMTQVTQVQGDMARTLESPANQMRIFQAQTEQAARALGNIFIPALNAILPYAIAAVKVLRIIADAIASLFNFTLPEMDYSNIGKTGNQVAEGLEDANKEATKLKRTLLGIDELNVLPDTSGSGSDVGGGGSFDFELPTYDFIGEATSSRVNQIVEEMKAWLGITDDINSWSDLLDTRLGDILKTAGLIGGAIALWKVSNGFLSAINTLQGLLANPATSIVIGVTIAITGFKLAFDGMDDAIENGVDGFNFAEIISGSLLSTAGVALLGTKIAGWITTAFAGSAVSNALTAAAINLFGQTAGPISASAVAAAGGVLMAAVAGIVLGIPTYFVGIYDAVMKGLNWMNSLLISAGATLAGAGIGAIIGMLGGPIGAGVGALVGLAVGLLTDFGIWLWQKFDSIEAWFMGLPNWAKVIVGVIGVVITAGGGLVTMIAGWIAGVITFIKKWEDIKLFLSSIPSWFDTNVIQPVVGFFRGLWTSVSGFFVNLWTDMVAIFTAVPGWFDSNVIQPVTRFFVDLWNGITNTASECWGAVVSFFSPAIEWFSALFGSVQQTLSDVFYNIGVIASGCWEIIKAAWGIVNTWFDTKIIQPLSNRFTQFWDGIRTKAINAWSGIKNTYAAIENWINTEIIQPVTKRFTNLWNSVKTGAINAWTGIKAAYTSITTWFDTQIVQPVSKRFTNLWNGFVNGAKSAWEGTKTVFSKAGTFFSDTFKKAWERVVNVFSVAGEIFKDIKDGIVTAFKSVVNGLIKGLNRVIAEPFNGINKALEKIRDINILGLTPFSSLRSISIPAIPYLAEGGVVDSGQLFVANEAGPELVANAGRKTAVMNNDQIVDSVSQGVYRAVVQAMGQSSGNQVVEAKVNDKVLFEVVVNRNRQETMRTGFSPLLGGV